MAVMNMENRLTDSGDTGKQAGQRTVGTARLNLKSYLLVLMEMCASFCWNG
jgi:hypothetical protein